MADWKMFNKLWEASSFLSLDRSCKTGSPWGKNYESGKFEVVFRKIPIAKNLDGHAPQIFGFLYKYCVDLS